MAHKSLEEIFPLIKSAGKKIPKGSIYSHYKHPEQHYVIEFVGCWENTEEVCVGYRALYGKKILWVRPLENFLERVEVDGKKVPRFRKI